MLCVMLKLSSLAGNSQRLDGGAMFGNAPRALWSRWAPPDELGRIPLACRSFLAESAGQRILIEAGIGAFFPPELRERYGVVESHHVLLQSLAALGLTDADIDVVILSHLHFDHAGGLLAQHREGEPLRLLFPRARFVIGRTAFERARAPHDRDRASFIPELPQLLLDTGRLVLVDDESSAQGLLGPEFRFVETEGHTTGMLHTWVSGEQASAFFCADLVPGQAWVHLPITMGYDRFPERLIDEKAKLFAELSAARAHLLFTHDPSVAAARLGRGARQRYCAVDASGEFCGWDLDLAAAPSSERTTH